MNPNLEWSYFQTYNVMSFIIFSLTNLDNLIARLDPLIDFNRLLRLSHTEHYIVLLAWISCVREDRKGKPESYWESYWETMTHSWSSQIYISTLVTGSLLLLVIRASITSASVKVWSVLATPWWHNYLLVNAEQSRDSENGRLTHRALARHWQRRQQHQEGDGGYGLPHPFPWLQPQQPGREEQPGQILSCLDAISCTYIHSFLSPMYCLSDC